MATCYYEGEPYDCSFTDKFVLPIFDSIDQSSIATIVKDSTLIVPWAGSFHLLALGLLGGAIIMADLRVIGPGLHSQSPQSLNRKMRPFLLAAVAVLIASGSLLALGEMMKLFYSPPYWVKMASLVSALIFTFGVRDSLIHNNGKLTPVAVGLGILSLGVWLCVFIAMTNTLARAAFLIMFALLGLAVWLSGRSADSMPLLARLGSATTIALWMTTAVAGRWIAFW